MKTWQVFLQAQMETQSIGIVESFYTDRLQLPARNVAQMPSSLKKYNTETRLQRVGLYEI